MTPEPRHAGQVALLLRGARPPPQQNAHRTTGGVRHAFPVRRGTIVPQGF